MQITANELSSSYFSLLSIFSKQDKKPSVSKTEEQFWSVSFDSGNINFKSPISSSTYNAGQIFSSELVKNNTKGLGNPFWGLVSFQAEQIDDKTPVQSLDVDNIEEWSSIPFGGIFSAYKKIK